MTALEDAQDALRWLRASTSYRDVKRAHPTNFATTPLGKCEISLLATVAALSVRPATEPVPALPLLFRSHS